MKTTKKWKDMSDAERKKERTRIKKQIQKSETQLRKSPSGQILSAHTDGRESRFDGPEMNAAIWGLRQKGKLIPRRSKTFMGMDEFVLQKLADGDSDFFKKLAIAMDNLSKSKAVVTENGLIIPLQYTVKSAILDHWEAWEKSGEKIEVRLAKLKEQGYIISSQRYHTLVKQIGLK